MKVLLSLIVLALLSGCAAIIVPSGREFEGRDTTKEELEKSAIQKSWNLSDHPIDGRINVFSKTKWCGVAFWVVIIPVPLMLPVCTDSVDIIYANNLPIKIETVEHGEYFIGCGPFVPYIPMHGGSEYFFCQTGRLK